MWQRGTLCPPVYALQRSDGQFRVQTSVPYGWPSFGVRTPHAHCATRYTLANARRYAEHGDTVVHVGYNALWREITGTEEAG